MVLYNTEKIIKNNYKIIERAGASGQSVYYKCELIDSNKNNKKQYYFLKIYHDIDVQCIDDINLFFSNIIKKLKGYNNIFCLPVINKKRELEIGCEDNSIYIVFPWIDGSTLTNYLKMGNLNNDQTKSIILGLLSACTKLDEAGIIHLDIKPDNIFITESGDKTYIRIIDLDISKIYKPTEKNITV